jgi:hypothetical protein
MRCNNQQSKSLSTTMSSAAEKNNFALAFSPDSTDDELEISRNSESAGLRTQKSTTQSSIQDVSESGTGAFVPLEIETPARPGSAPPSLASPSKDAKKFTMPECLQSVTMKDKDRFVICHEMYSSRGGNGQIYPVVSGFRLNETDTDGKQKVYAIDKLKHDQLRVL